MEGEDRVSLPQLGRYAIFGPLGEGGMGRVYLARASGAAGFSRVVAIKETEGTVTKLSIELKDGKAVAAPSDASPDVEMTDRIWAIIALGERYPLRRPERLRAIVVHAAARQTASLLLECCHHLRHGEFHNSGL